MKTLQIVKSLKISFDTLGYMFADNEITSDREAYRKYLRSGKSTPIQKRSDNRTFQTLNSYAYYFKPNFNPLLRCDYKEVISYLLNFNKTFYYKSTKKVGNNLLKLGYLEVYNLTDAVLIKDNFNKNTFYYCNITKLVYRLINNKSIIYKLN